MQMEVDILKVTGFDHLSFPVADPEGFLAFYKNLGFQILQEAEWRSGTTPMFAVRIGNDQKLNVHPSPWLPPEHLRGRSAAPGCADVCVRWSGTVDEVQKYLADRGVPVTAGPLGPRPARDGIGASWSIYVTDPEGNLLEFIVYEV